MQFPNVATDLAGKHATQKTSYTNEALICIYLTGKHAHTELNTPKASMATWNSIFPRQVFLQLATITFTQAQIFEHWHCRPGQEGHLKQQTCPETKGNVHIPNARSSH